MVSDPVIIECSGIGLMLIGEERARHLGVDRSNAPGVNAIDLRTGAGAYTPRLGPAGPTDSGLLPTHSSHTSWAGRA